MTLKKNIILMAAPLTLAMNALTACSDSDDNPITPDPSKPASVYGTYNGDFTAYATDGTLSMQGKDQTARLAKGEGSDTLFMDQIRFAASMPMALNIRFGSIRVQNDGSTLTLMQPVVVPEAVVKGKWTPIAEQSIADFEGHAVKDSLYLNFTCGGKWFHYAGKYRQQ